jgi:2-polyprenyl-3-methyl-5-hydroxy-6-metoxy-1,4-benzoquinol methylase
MRRLLRLLDPLLQGRLGELVAGTAFRAWVSAISRQRPEVAARRLLQIADGLLARVDVLAVELDGGIHAKHRLMRYHDFFLERVRADERVLDVGCGKGELAYDLATRGGVLVTGIDVNAGSLAFARVRFPSDRLELVEADALEWVPSTPYDVVVLSNVLEHVADRVGLLRRLVELARPDRLLIRVPVLERDWLVGLRRELGIPYFSDPTHQTEYSPEQLEAELRDAGLRLDELLHRWGELWAVARPEP